MTETTLVRVLSEKDLRVLDKIAELGDRKLSDELGGIMGDSVKGVIRADRLYLASLQDGLRIALGVLVREKDTISLPSGMRIRMAGKDVILETDPSDPTENMGFVKKFGVYQKPEPELESE